tara:strand:- start:137 stop:358 length:222 start_codon:yes stop_codon:yes gene_type:complete
MLQTKTIGQFGFNYKVDHLGTLRGIDGHKKDSVLITFIFDQMPTEIIKKAQNEFLYEFSGIDVNFRIPWSKAI